MSTDEIDALLERYLNLLDQYTSLRNELGTLQSSIHQDIARANFSAERGIRYGQDLYDDRMRASRTIQITPHALESLSSSSSSLKDPSTPIFTMTTTTTAITAATPESTAAPATPQKLKNPLTMFGILVPPPLRTAQGSAVTMVSSVIPQLVSVDAEMREVEICIRRARKKQQQHHRKQEAQQQTAKGSQGDPSRNAALLAMATRDGPTPKGILREGPAPPYVEVRFAEEGE